MISNDNHVIRITPPESTLCQVEAPVICPEESCKKIFLSKSVLNMHFTQVHEHRRITSKSKNSQNPIKHYHCPIENCIYYEKQQKHFAKFKYLKQHFLKVHAVCKFSCEQCNKKFAAQSLLNAHLMYCDLNLICSCGSTFSFIESLLTHVRRTKHEADVLNLYFQRIKKRKLMRSPVSKVIANTANSLSCLPQVTTVNSLSSTSKILPKPQSRHIIAALALSEMAYAGLQRLPSVDVGVQTEFMPTKRLTKKCSMSPIRSKSPAIKRKQTTEMETQTRLTNLKNKKRKGSSRNVAKCSIGLTTDSNNSLLAKKTISKNQKYLKDKNVETLEVRSNITYKPQCAYSDIQTVSFMHLSENFDDHYSLNFNTSGTQTSPRVSLSTTMMPRSNIDNITYNLFDNHNNGIQCMMNLKAVESIPLCSRISEDIANADLISQEFKIKVNKVENNISIEESAIAGCSLCPKYESRDLLIDEDENYETLEDSSKYSHININARRLSFSQIRSSSIETQTDHDVFLSNIQPPDDADDINLTSTETQTDHDANSLWCTSETQTCEEFSDIEQFLCSTIHTQTHDENNSNELFPELNFTADTQTQTCMDDSPLLITTHTQTSVLGL